MSPGTISNLVVQFVEALQAFASRRLDDTSFRYVLVEARYEKVHTAGAVLTHLQMGQCEPHIMKLQKILDTTLGRLDVIQMTFDWV